MSVLFIVVSPMRKVFQSRLIVHMAWYGVALISSCFLILMTLMIFACLVLVFFRIS